MQYNKLIIHALHKSGSMFLFRYFQRIAELTELPFYSQNLPTQNQGLFWDSSNGILSPYRMFVSKNLEGCKSLFLLRHPLDMLVSQYYSFAYMHAPNPNGYEPGKHPDLLKKMSVDEFCLYEASDLYRRYSPILDLIEQEGKDKFIFVSYLDMVVNFSDFNKKICTELKLAEKFHGKLNEEFSKEFNPLPELTPSEIINDGKKRHKRVMLPGDHKRKLSENIQKVLLDKFEKHIKLLNEIVIPITQT